MRHPMRHHTRRPARHHTRRLDASSAHASLAAAEASLLLAPRLWEALGRAAWVAALVAALAEAWAL
eukprot:165180-Prymnesium_polylepis.1